MGRPSSAPWRRLAQPPHRQPLGRRPLRNFLPGGKFSAGPITPSSRTSRTTTSKTTGPPRSTPTGAWQGAVARAAGLGDDGLPHDL